MLKAADERQTGFVMYSKMFVKFWKLVKLNRIRIQVSCIFVKNCPFTRKTVFNQKQA